MKKILIIGGYGNAGYLIAEYISTKVSDIHIIIAGRNLNRAEQAVGKLKSETNLDCFSAMRLDASDTNQLKNAFQNIDIVIVASSAKGLTENIVNSAIETNTDYFDVNLSTKEKIDFIFSKEAIIKEKGLCFITDGGFHPGLPSAMIRYAAGKHDNIISANVYSVMQMDWSKIQVSDETAEEMVLEFKDYKPEIFKDGKWIIPKSNNLYRKFNFSAPYNAQTVVPMTMEELRIIPKLYPTIKETGFYVAGFNKFTDWFFLPLMMYVLLPLFGRFGIKPLAKLFMISLQKFSKPPFGLKLVADIFYKEDEKEQNIQYELSHEDGYKLTAIPVVVCLMQYFENRKTGLFYQAEYPEQNRFFEDMEKMGIELKVRRDEE